MIEERATDAADNRPLWLILIAFVCALGPLVFIHELGHYLVARWFGIGAETFSIGFGREMVGWTDKRGTRWKVGWLPLGGYVRFVGDMRPGERAGVEADDFPPEQRARAFQFRPVWQRFLVVLAGPMANFLLAILIFAAFFALIGAPRTPMSSARSSPGTAAAAAGIEPGDRILSIAGRDTASFDEIFNAVAIRPGEQVDDRPSSAASDPQRRSVAPRPDTIEDVDSARSSSVGLLGDRAELTGYERVPAWQALPVATAYTLEPRPGRSSTAWCRSSRGATSAKQLGGPIKIAQIAGQKAQRSGFCRSSSCLRCFQLISDSSTCCQSRCWMAAISLFYAVEAVRRRPLSARAHGMGVPRRAGAHSRAVLFTTVNDLGSIGLWEGFSA